MEIYVIFLRKNSSLRKCLKQLFFFFSVKHVSLNIYHNEINCIKKLKNK